MTRDQVIDWISQRIADTSFVQTQTSLLVVEPATQQLHFLPGNGGSQLSHSYPVSTAAKGLGNRNESNQTPTGVHRIAAKIGDGEPAGMVFRGRKPTGELAADMDNQAEDQITSRILWLEGLEPGINLGADCDSYQRYIYIHGTSDEGRIGQAVSAGCVRMKNQDVIDLFERVETGAVVLIRSDEN